MGLVRLSLFLIIEELHCRRCDIRRFHEDASWFKAASLNGSSCGSLTIVQLALASLWLNMGQHWGIATSHACIC